MTDSSHTISFIEYLNSLMHDIDRIQADASERYEKGTPEYWMYRSIKIQNRLEQCIQHSLSFAQTGKMGHIDYEVQSSRKSLQTSGPASLKSSPDLRAHGRTPSTSKLKFKRSNKGRKSTEISREKIIIMNTDSDSFEKSEEGSRSNESLFKNSRGRNMSPGDTPRSSGTEDELEETEKPIKLTFENPVQLKGQILTPVIKLLNDLEWHKKYLVEMEFTKSDENSFQTIVFESVWEKYFKGTEHYNYIGKDTNGNWEIISVKSQSDGHGHLACRNSGKGFEKFYVPDLYVASQSKKLSLKFHEFIENLYQRTFYHLTGDKINNFMEDICALEAVHGIRKDKFLVALIYCKVGQNDPFEMFENKIEDMSEQCINFFKFFGFTTEKPEGNYEEIKTIWNNKPFIWHPAPLMNSDEHRRYIGNDSVVIFFKDEGESFDPLLTDNLGVMPQFFLVIQPYNEKYRIGCYQKTTLTVFGPPLLKNLVLDLNDLKEFIYCKIYNGSITGLTCEPLLPLIFRPRCAAMGEVIENYQLWKKRKINLTFCYLASKVKLFKVTIDSYMVIQKATIPFLNVPWLIRLCSDEIMKRGLTLSGIFRVPGSSETINELSENCSKGIVPDLSQVGIEEISGLWKKFLRELPKPILSDDTADNKLELQFVSIAEMDGNDTQKIEDLRKAIRLLTIYKRALLREMFYVLNAVSHKSEVNLMNSSNLATIFGGMSKMESTKKTHLCKFMIDKYSELFFGFDTLDSSILQPVPIKSKLAVCTIYFKTGEMLPVLLGKQINDYSKITVQKVVDRLEKFFNSDWTYWNDSHQRSPSSWNLLLIKDREVMLVPNNDPASNWINVEGASLLFTNEQPKKIRTRINRSNTERSASKRKTSSRKLTASDISYVKEKQLQLPRNELSTSSQGKGKRKLSNRSTTRNIEVLVVNDHKETNCKEFQDGNVILANEASSLFSRQKWDLQDNVSKIGLILNSIRSDEDMKLFSSLKKAINDCLTIFSSIPSTTREERKPVTRRALKAAWSSFKQECMDELDVLQHKTKYLMSHSLSSKYDVVFFSMIFSGLEAVEILLNAFKDYESNTLRSDVVGTMFFRISEAKDLVNEASLALGDPEPYVTVSIDDKIVATTLARKGKQPGWYQDYDIQVSPSTDYVHFKVIDANYSVQILKDDLPKNQIQENWIALLPPGKAKIGEGRVHLITDYTSDSFHPTLKVQVVSVKDLHQSTRFKVFISGKNDRPAAIHKTKFSKADGIINESFTETEKLRDQDLILKAYQKNGLKKVLTGIVSIPLASLTPLLSEEMSINGVDMDELKAMIETEKGRGVIKLKKPSKRKDIDNNVKKDMLYRIYPTPSKLLGSIRLSLRYSEKYIFPIHVYSDFIEWLKQDPTSVSDLISTLADTVSDRKSLFSSLIDIYEKTGEVLSWITNLIEREVAATEEPTTLFRANSTAAIAIEAYLLFSCRELLSSLSSLFIQVLTSKDTIELDHEKIKDTNEIRKNSESLKHLVDSFWKIILESSSRFPYDTKRLLSNIRMIIKKKWPKDDDLPYLGVTAFVFLRYYCACILNPNLFNLTDLPSPSASRTLLWISRVLMNLANFQTMNQDYELINHWIKSKFSVLKTYIDNICTIPLLKPMEGVPTHYNDSLSTIQSFVELKRSKLAEMKDNSIPQLIKCMDVISQLIENQNKL